MGISAWDACWSLIGHTQTSPFAVIIASMVPGERTLFNMYATMSNLHRNRTFIDGNVEGRVVELQVSNVHLMPYVRSFKSRR